METSKLSDRVIELRNRKGFSQDVLAEKSGLSLRTIQRIENGETQPRGDTLQRIAKGLGVNSEELIDWKLEDNYDYLSLLNASALSFLFFPILGIIIPLVLWISKKKEIHKIDEVSKQVINFQITWCLFIFLIYVILISGFIFRFSFSIPIGPFGIIGTIAVLYIINIIQVIVNSIRLKNKKSSSYYLSIPFLR